MNRRAVWGLRGALAALGLWLCLGSPSTGLLRALVPLQANVFSTLMPDFAVSSFAVEQRGAHLKLRATSVNQRYLVLQGRAHAPGYSFAVETPARTCLVYAALVLGGIALGAHGSRRRLLWASGIATLVIGVMLALAAPVILAGQQWGLAVRAFEDASLAAALVAASNFMLHGGGYALCLAAVWAVVGGDRRGAATATPASQA